MTNRQHTYEEIREVVVDILVGRERVEYDQNQFQHLVLGVAEVFTKRAGQVLIPYSGIRPERLHTSDAELVRDVFWDLFRQGMITLGMNGSNEAWPFFRLSYLGKKALATESPYRFHDSASYLALVRKADPDISDAALTYLDEAVQTFYSGCMFATCVMLGVAAEAEFLRLIDVAAANASDGARFKAAAKEKFIAGAIKEFNKAVAPMVSGFTPKGDFENLDANLSTIQNVIRVARNDAGHPKSGTPPEREQVFVYMQLFVPFMRQIANLRRVLA